MTNNTTKKINKNTIRNIVIAAVCFLLILVSIILIASDPAEAQVVADNTPIQPDVDNFTFEIVVIPEDDNVIVEENEDTEKVEESTDIDNTVESDSDVKDDTTGVDEIPDFDDDVSDDIIDTPVIEDVIEEDTVVEEEIVEDVLFEINYDVCYNITFQVENVGRFIVKLDNYCDKAVMYFMYIVTTCEEPMTFTKTSDGLVLDVMGEQVLFLEETVTFNGETFGYVRVGFNVVNNMIFGETTTFNVVNTLVEEY